LVDPHIALLNFQEAFAEGLVPTTAGAVHPDLRGHMDEPEPGVIRLTFALPVDGEIAALVMFIEAEPIDGSKCFGVAYAADENLRSRGLATRALERPSTN